MAANIFFLRYVLMKIEKGMILSSLLTLSSPLVSFLKNSKIAPVPDAALSFYCFSACLEGDEANDTSPPVTVWPAPVVEASFFYKK